MRRYVFFTLLSGLITHSCTAQQEQPKPMNPQAHPHFEVATIKPTELGHKGQGFHTNGTRLYYENESMNDLLAQAFNINRGRIMNAPNWFSTVRYDIHGMADTAGIPSEAQQAEMTRILLEERFGLKVHHEQRDMTRILVTVAHSGPKLTPTKSTESLPDETCNGGGIVECRFTGVPIKDFAILLSFFLDKPVVDVTKLTDKYDFVLKWTRDDAPTNPDVASTPGLFTAMLEQLGLKAESSKGPTDVIIIDQVEKPSDN